MSDLLQINCRQWKNSVIPVSVWQT